jgi:NAD(P)H dehydrogenase (quinone)
MADSESVLVTGATGNTGSVVLEQLLRRGVGVRVMVRRDSDAARFASLGTDVAVADFETSQPSR